MSQIKPEFPEKKIVWMKCRAKESCPGNEAYLFMVVTQDVTVGGGKVYRYSCTTCKGSWHLTR